MTNRIGPQMESAVSYVSDHPGCAILPVAKHLHIGARRGTDNSLGYNPVHRAIKARLLVNVPAQRTGRGLYALYTSDQIEGLMTLTLALRAVG